MAQLEEEADGFMLAGQELLDQEDPDYNEEKADFKMASELVTKDLPIEPIEMPKDMPKELIEEIEKSSDEVEIDSEQILQSQEDNSQAQISAEAIMKV